MTNTTINQFKFSNALNDAQRVSKIIREKKAIYDYYDKCFKYYQKWQPIVDKEKIKLDIGSGLGMVKEYIPDIITSDIIPYPNIDEVFDARKIPFPDESVGYLTMMHVFHHIPDVEQFLVEANRVLCNSGRLLLIEPYTGIISNIINKYFHHEGFDTKINNWKLKPKNEMKFDPLADANQAISWVVFKRDFKLFEERFPQLRLIHFEKHTPLQYWFGGGLKNWNLLSIPWIFHLIKWLDRILIQIHPNFGSFANIIIEKREAEK